MMRDLRANSLETIVASQRLSALAEIRHRLTKIKYSQKMRRFMIRLHKDIEVRLPALMRERLYADLAGIDLKKAIYRDLFELTNLVYPSDERLEKLYAHDNEHA